MDLFLFIDETIGSVFLVRDIEVVSRWSVKLCLSLFFAPQWPRGSLREGLVDRFTDQDLAISVLGLPQYKHTHIRINMYVYNIRIKYIVGRNRTGGPVGCLPGYCHDHVTRVNNRSRDPVPTKQRSSKASKIREQIIKRKNETRGV